MWLKSFIGPLVFLTGAVLVQFLGTVFIDCTNEKSFNAGCDENQSQFRLGMRGVIASVWP